jgi:hypothetical protein
VRAFIGVALALVLGAAPAQAQPVEHDLAWLGAEVEAQPGSLGRECLESAMRSQAALTAFRHGAIPDDEVRSALASGVTDPTLMTMRKAEGDLWVRTHDPSVVAADHLTRCLALGGVTLKPAVQTKDCLENVAPVVKHAFSDEEIHEYARGLAACFAAAGSGASVHAGAAGPPCILLFGGGGTVSGNPTVDGNWFKIDSAIADGVIARLRDKSYDVRTLITDDHDPSRLVQALMVKLTETRCAKTVQISHELKSTNGSGLVNSFSIKAAVLVAKPQDRLVKFDGEYNKHYDFAMTKQVLDELIPSELGERMADDIIAAGVLPKR